MKPVQLTWMDNPTIQGGQMAILTGDPARAETVVMRFKFPANRPAPHSRPHAEIVTVLSGRVGYGEGSKFDTSIVVFPHIVMAENAGAILDQMYPFWHGGGLSREHFAGWRDAA